MKIRTIKIYQCEFCGKIYLNKARAKEHEYSCPKSPKNDTLCFNCENLNHNEDEAFPYCKKIDNYICTASEVVYNKYGVECYGAEEAKKKCSNYKFQNIRRKLNK